MFCASERPTETKTNHHKTENDSFSVNISSWILFMFCASEQPAWPAPAREQREAVLFVLPLSAPLPRLRRWSLQLFAEWETERMIPHRTQRFSEQLCQESAAKRRHPPQSADAAAKTHRDEQLRPSWQKQKREKTKKKNKQKEQKRKSIFSRVKKRQKKPNKTRDVRAKNKAAKNPKKFALKTKTRVWSEKKWQSIKRKFLRWQGAANFELGNLRCLRFLDKKKKHQTPWASLVSLALTSTTKKPLKMAKIKSFYARSWSSSISMPSRTNRRTWCHRPSKNNTVFFFFFPLLYTWLAVCHCLGNLGLEHVRLVVEKETPLFFAFAHFSGGMAQTHHTSFRTE